VAAAALDHAGQHGAGEHHRSQQIHVGHRSQFVDRDFVGPDGRLPTGVVHQDVDATRDLLGARHQRGRLSAVTEIHRQRRHRDAGGRPDFVGDGVEAVLTSRG